MWYGDKKIAKDMTKDQLEKRFEFGLHYLDIGRSALGASGFKFKELSKKSHPFWPLIMQMFTSQAMAYFNAPMCAFNKQDMELL